MQMQVTYDVHNENTDIHESQVLHGYVDAGDQLINFEVIGWSQDLALCHPPFPITVIAYLHAHAQITSHPAMKQIQKLNKQPTLQIFIYNLMKLYSLAGVNG